MFRIPETGMGVPLREQVRPIMLRIGAIMGDESVRFNRDASERTMCHGVAAQTKTESAPGGVAAHVAATGSHGADEQTTWD